MISRRRIARRKAVAASSEARSGARTRASSAAISVRATTSRAAGTGARVRERMRSWPTTSSAMRSSSVSTPEAPVSSERSSDGDRAATARIALEGSMRTRLASSARAAARRISGTPAPFSSAAQSSSRPSSSGADPEAAERAGRW